MKATFRILATAVMILCCAAACSKHTPYRNTDTSGTGTQPGGGGNTPGGGSTTVKAQLMSNWVIQYKGREEYTEEDGSVSDVERFHIEAPGAAYYLVRTINPDVFSNNYGTDVITFFQDEQGFLEQDAQTYNEKVTDYLYNQTPQDILFDRIRHGQWQGYLIGFNAQGKITGQYAVCNFTVQEETPTAAFSKWLGDWRVSDGTTTYDIKVSSSEANYAYFIDGWETGASIDPESGTSMDGNEDYFETFFEPSNGAMYFMSQYIQTYKDGDVTYDQFFFGNILVNGHVIVDGQLIKNGEYIIPEENLDIAAAQMIDLNNNRAQILGCNIKAYLTDSDQQGYDTQFSSMQYIADNGTDLLKFNLNAPQFPLTMDRIEGGAAPSSVKAAVARRPVTRQALKHLRIQDVQKRKNTASRKVVARQAAN